MKYTVWDLRNMNSTEQFFLDKIQEVTAGDKKGYGISEDADGTDAVQSQNPLDIGPFGNVEN